MDINKVILVGRLTHDIELKSTDSGNQYIQFNIAVNNGKDKDGNERGADFLTCVAWGKNAENLSVYLHKGNRVAIEGRLKVDSYDGTDGNKKYKTYVLIQTFEFLESKPKDSFTPQEPDYVVKQNSETPEDPYASFGNQITVEDLDRKSIVSDDDLPF